MKRLKHQISEKIIASYSSNFKHIYSDKLNIFRVNMAVGQLLRAQENVKTG